MVSTPFPSMPGSHLQVEDPDPIQNSLAYPLVNTLDGAISVVSCTTQEIPMLQTNFSAFEKKTLARYESI